MSKYKIKIMDNERTVVSMHPFNPNQNKPPFTGGKKSTRYKGLMKRKDYQNTIKRWCAKLFQYRIDSDKCRFITLTLAENMEWPDLINAFDNFLKSAYRKFGKFEYVRGVEVQACGKFHIHAVLIFNDAPPDITSDWLKKYWRYGESYIDPKTNVYDVYGLIEYLTLFKVNSCQKHCFNATYFPSGAKLISTSYNMPKADMFEIEIDEDELIDLNSYCIKNNKFIRYDGHYYPHPSGGMAYCEDRQYMHNIKDYIISNFGTNEVNAKLKK